MEKIKKAPIRFLPYLKSVIWGGDKICAYKGIAREEEKIGESWEISEVPGHVSVVAEGDYKGEDLSGLISRFGENLLGKKVYSRYDGKFPLLIKIIDANDNLSVQVHPDDSLARKRHNCLGKTEMWYIISAEPDARIYAGLSKPLDPEKYEAMVADGSFTDALASHDSCPGDVFFLPAGRVHAIGAGNLLAEIQESSDITYRIFDYNRLDANGNTRELHTELAKDAIDYKVYDSYKSASPSGDVKDAVIAECGHFRVERILINGADDKVLDPDSFTVVMCISGTVVVICPDGSMEIRKGTTVLLPAGMERVSFCGEGNILLTQV